MKTTGRLLAATAVLALVAPAAGANDVIKLGVTATLEGTYTPLGEDGMRGFQLAINKMGGKVAGKTIEYVVVSTDTSPDSAVRAVRKLVEQDQVDLVIAPLSGSEGIAVKEFAKSQPQMTFINSASGALETTFVDPAPNFYRFNSHGAQMSAGLGNYIFNEKGWRRIATVGEDYSFVYTQVFGLVTEFCAAGGEVTERLWVPLGTKDFASIIAALPDDVDAIYLGLGGGDAVNFLNQYQQAGGDANLIGGSIMVDQTVLSSRGRAKEALLGTPSSGPQADTSDEPKWRAFVEDYQSTFPPDKRFATPSLLATYYYNNTMAALTALEQVGGDLSDGHAKFRAALESLVLDSPVGEIRLGTNRHAIVPNYVTEVVEGPDGNLVNQQVAFIPSVDETLNMDPEKFRALGLPSRDNPECRSSY